MQSWANFFESVSRYLALGSIKSFQADDLLMLLAVAFYTVVIVTLNIVATAETNLFPPEFDVATLTSADISHRQYGSKLVLVVEQSQCCAVWATKCLLTLFISVDTANPS